MKKFYAVMTLLFALVTGTVFGSIEAQAASDDITGITLEKEMREMIELDVLQGFSDGVYKPKVNVTRGQFATFIYRALDLPVGDKTYPDVALDSSLADGISGASSAGIVTGYSNGKFGPNDKITREQMAVMIQRALKFYNIELQQADMKFTDSSQFNSSEIKRAVAVNVHYKIIQGIPNKDNTHRFEPKSYAKRDQAAAVISRLLTAVEENVDEEIKTYSVSKIENGKLVPIKSYSSYSAAVKAWDGSNNQVVTNGKDVVKMNTGIAVTVATPAGSNTNIYPSEGSSSAETYVAFDTELKYLDSTEDRVKIQIGDRIGYVKQENVKLEPINMVEERSYYKVNNGLLYHYIYSDLNDTYGSYNVGKAPSELKEGAIYYSWDGSTFMNASTGKVVGPVYQYFQYLPARTKTSYTAEEIDSFILNRMKELEKAYPNDPKYQNASKKGKLIGIGSYLKEVEKEKKINALHILSLAFHEGQYGLSPRAQTYNNLFGLRVYDDDPKNDYFESVEENIDEFIELFWNKNYIPPSGPYANGAMFGNKVAGFNVRYASDPYWGAKAAGHYYRIDKAMGSKDFNKYQIGLTNTDGLNFRSEPTVSSSTFLFEYRNANRAIVILDELDRPDRTWIKTISDDIRYNEVYVAGEFVDKINIAK
ncbi:S-layer homology domain-containing protein [Bacillus seohaeanensis]|uniref:S-layer homology domain-containing protein n=1 Tax=Bacillus seohaeanensis TaxID=284580 RepID=A0ABW5RYQ5_9BACI